MLIFSSKFSCFILLGFLAEMVLTRLHHPGTKPLQYLEFDDYVKEWQQKGQTVTLAGPDQDQSCVPSMLHMT